ncbi:MAG: hemolysin family protein [Chitinophagales bacterium]
MEIYIILIAALVLSGLFSGIEIAYVSSNKFKIELGKESNSLSDRILSKFAFNDSVFITSLLIGNNIVLVVFSYFISEVFVRDFGIVEETLNSLLLQTVITTVVVLIFGEFLPKTLFTIAPNKILKYFAIPINLIAYIPFKYIAMFFAFISSKTIGIFTQVDEIDENLDQFSSTDLKHYIKGLVDEENEDGDDDEINSELFEKALEFKEIRVKECMVPRTELKAVNQDISIPELIKEFINLKHSRLLVYNESIDDIVGYVHHFDLFKEPQSVKEIMFEVVSVPDTMNARDLLTLFTNEDKNIAYVFDEYGGTAGIVTLEDLIEEIFGEIEDEHDDTNYEEEQISENEFIFSARLEVDYINEKYGLEIPEGEFETLAGFIVVHNEDIPKAGEEIVIDNFIIKILLAENNRIEKIKIKKVILAN